MFEILAHHTSGSDSEGNTLLHLALDANNSEYSVSAVKILAKKGLVLDGWNTHQHMAVDNLSSHNIKCAELLIDFFITRMTGITKEAEMPPVDRIREFQWLDDGDKRMKRKQQKEKTETAADDGNVATACIGATVLQSDHMLPEAPLMEVKSNCLTLSISQICNFLMIGVF